MSPDDLLTRDEVLGGLPAKRAATLLFLIESRTAHLADRSRRAMEFFLTEDAAYERELAFLEAFSLGRESPLRPTIQDLERYAPQWASLVPDNPQVQAALAHLVGQKYRFTAQAVPGIRTALGLDEAVVQQAYQRLYRELLDRIFVPRPTPAQRLRWTWAALAGWADWLPPFWTTFVLTIALPLPAAFLALPIAVARVGPLSGLLFLLVIGLLNVLTMACMAEACGRSGPMRYGKTFLGRLVADFLGNAGSSLLSLALGIRNFLTLLSSSFGMAITMAAFTGVPAGAWITLLFVIEVYLLSRKTLKLTVTAMVLLAAMNIVLILSIALLASTHATTENLFSGRFPFLRGEPMDPMTFRLVFGVVLSLYFGHIYVVHCAKIVLPRDPSASSLIRGSVAGTASLIALLALWIVAIGAAITPQALAGQTGTVLTPLADQLGPSIQMVGSLLIIFFLGMSSIRTGNVVFNLVHERLPSRLQTIVVLPRRRVTLLLSHRGPPGRSPRLGVTYLGLTEGQPQIRLDAQWDGKIHRREVTVSTHWDAAALLDQLPEPRPRRINFSLDVLQASPTGIQLRVTTPMRLRCEGTWDTGGLDLAGVLALSDSTRRLVTWMMRQAEVSLASAAAYVGHDQELTHRMLEELARQEVVEVITGQGEPRYRIHLTARRRRQMPHEIWQPPDAQEQAPGRSDRVSLPKGAGVVGQGIREALLSERGRFLLSFCPVVGALLLAWWLLATGAGSFTWLISLTGVLTLTLASGIFPVLLLISSRRKGDYVPGIVYRFLSHPALVGTIYVFFLANLFLHGLVIWQNPLARASAIIVGLGVIGVTMAMRRAGAFTPRIVVELREDQREEGRGILAVTAGGQPTVADVRLGYRDNEERHQVAAGDVPRFSSLRHATFHLPVTSSRELKVWAHAVTPEGSSEALPAVVEIYNGNETRRFDLKLSGGQVVLPLTGDACSVRITLAEPSPV